MQKDLLDAEMELFTKQHDGGPEIDQIQQKVTCHLHATSLEMGF